MVEKKSLPMQSPAPWVGYSAITLRKTFELHAVAEEALYFEGNGAPHTGDPFTNKLVLGVQGCVWTELIKDADTLEYQLFPRLLAVADAGWSRRLVEQKKLKKAKSTAVEKIDTIELTNASEGPEGAENKRRIKNLLKFATGSLAEVAHADVGPDEFRTFEDAVMLLGLASATRKL
eukprot:GDKJ01052624.1.p1 GENE.GDKJ01052624.1~~GDKJ01052624.1.p1  ORF type:complete len:176 (+),score=11.85 GDKJ01052624.1:2-529(+)